MRLCGAKNRQGQPCSQPAMANGRCRYHGGKSLVGIASPRFKHGRYSRAIPADLIESFKQSLTDPDQLSLSAEMAVIDSRVTSLLSQLQNGPSADAWNEFSTLVSGLRVAAQEGDDQALDKIGNRLQSFVEQLKKTTSIWDQLHKSIDLRRRLSETEIRRVQAASSWMPAGEMLSLAAAMLQSIKTHVQDRETLNAIAVSFDELLNRPKLEKARDETNR